MEIPKQLENQRFIKTDHQKRPYEKGWTQTANYNYQESLEFTSDTYGVLCGHNRLVIIDCDKKYIQDKLLTIPEIRETFTTKTATKKLYHFYFYVDVDNPKSFSIKNERNETSLDFLATGKQAIGPGSVIPGIGKYEIVNPREIATIDYNFLKEILANLEPNIKIIQENQKVTKKEGFYYDFDEVCVAIKKKIKPNDILPEEYKDKSPTMCPLGHESKSKKCFCTTDDVWYCFNCKQTGNVIQLYQQIHNVNFLEAKRDLAAMAGINNDFIESVLKLYSDSKTRMKASELVAKEFINQNHVYTIRNDNDSKMWIYDNGIYIPNAKTYIREFCRRIFSFTYKTGFANQIIDKIMTDTYINEMEFLKQPDVNKVPIMNGILDIKTRKLEPFDPKYRFFNKLPVNYDPIIKSTTVEQFFKDILQDDNDHRVMQELFGYLLYRDNPFEKAFMFTGHGRNGKTKTLELAKRFIGSENVTNISLTQIQNDNFAAFNLYNKMANLSGDIGKKGLEDTSLFKQLTGQDSISANRKFDTRVDFTNYAKMIFACNELPYSYDDTDGFYDRWIMMDFKYKFVDNPSEPHHKKKDPHIIKKISTDKELSGLLNWALDGLDRLLKQGGFSNSTSTQEIRQLWRRKSSSMSAFLDDELICDYEKGVFVPTSEFNLRYFQYCKKHKIKPESTKSIKFKIKEFGGDEGKKRDGISTYNVYKWLRWKA